MQATTPDLVPPRPTPVTERERIHRSHTMHVSAPPEEVFPLLCPVREFDWIRAWECQVIYTASGVAEEGCVFLTQGSSADCPDTWVVSRFEPETRIAFVRVDSLRTMLYDITVEPSRQGGSRLHWSQEITALNEAGDEEVQALTQEAFVRQVDAIETMLEHYLRTGEALEIEE